VFLIQQYPAFPGGSARNDLLAESARNDLTEMNYHLTKRSIQSYICFNEHKALDDIE
jgi:hypothetical protein